MNCAIRRYRSSTIGLVSLAMFLSVAASPSSGAQAEPADADQLGAAAPALQTTETAPARRLQSLWTTVTVTLLLLLTFVVGTYVMVRVGRSIVRRPRRRTVTDYVDAWAGYRLTDEDVERATGDDAPNDSDEQSDQDSDEQG